MGILRKTLSASRSSTAVTIVPLGAKIQGDLMLDSQLHLDGDFEGLLDCGSTLVVGKNGRFKGRIRAGEVLVSGSIEAELVCTKLHILAGGRVKGRVSCDSFVLDEKGDFIGDRFHAGEQAEKIDEAKQLLERPLAAINSPELTLENLLDSLPTSVTLDK